MTTASKVAARRPEPPRPRVLAKGYAGATLDAIAEEAGFSKGVVYSQFECKAGLFLALLDHRIVERAEQNDRLAEGLSGPRLVEAAFQLADSLQQGEPDWALLVIEFRAHAAREPALRRRYAELHARTVDGLAVLLGRMHEQADTEPRVPVRVLAELVLAIGSGSALERVADPGALPAHLLSRIVAQAITASAGETDPDATSSSHATEAGPPA